MTRNKFILAGLLAGAMAFGTACKSNDSAEKGGMSTEPTQTQPQTPTTPQGTTTSPGTGGSEQVDPSQNVPPSDMGQEQGNDTGGSGYQDPMLFPEGDQNATQPLPDVRDQDPVQDPGIGGSGYEGDDSMLQEEDQRLGGDKFPGDHNVPQ